jgi:hypothetical protein
MAASAEAESVTLVALEPLEVELEVLELVLDALG